MVAVDAKFWACFEIECTLEAEISVSNLTQYKLFVDLGNCLTFSASVILSTQDFG